MFEALDDLISLLHAGDLNDRTVGREFQPDGDAVAAHRVLALRLAVGVVGMAELLCDTGLTEEQRLFAETIKSSGEALLVIINDILDFSKIESGQVTLENTDFGIEELVRRVYNSQEFKAEEKNIKLQITHIRSVARVFLEVKFPIINRFKLHCILYSVHYFSYFQTIAFRIV